MASQKLTVPRVKKLLAAARRTRVLVIGDVMLDQFLWGRVSRISPEAPVPVVDFERESFMPGGAANVARNLTSLSAQVELFGVIGRDPAGQQLKQLLQRYETGCSGLIARGTRRVSGKTRIVAHKQQVVRIDRETRDGITPEIARRLLGSLASALESSAALIVGDYGKGVVTQTLLDELKRICRNYG